MLHKLGKTQRSKTTKGNAPVFHSKSFTCRFCLSSNVSSLVYHQNMDLPAVTVDEYTSIKARAPYRREQVA